MQALNQVFALHLALSQPPTARFRYRKSYFRHFNNGSLSFISVTNTLTYVFSISWNSQGYFLTVQHQYLESPAPQDGLTNVPEHLCR